ncbi:PH domain-containing protein [Rossellomorea marisflavi]|uniref:PH domain-containing protein n=1 Tax=Rossellomorea marisflavi TaxID=189381 RepID=UPI002079BAA4|nr:PH domain-containing protein [Rossellomorea marisflavi]USK92908.1 PH domain-containing protein [Rossellomorea marisflavi]
MYFPSKKDGWMGLLHLVILFLCFGLPVLSGEWVWIFVVPLVLGVVNLLIWCRTGYRVDGEDLVVHYGPITFKVPIRKIERVDFIKSPFVGPALSVDRMGITHSASKFLTVSPKDQEGFLQALKESNPHMVVNRT